MNGVVGRRTASPSFPISAVQSATTLMLSKCVLYATDRSGLAAENPGGDQLIVLALWCVAVRKGGVERSATLPISTSWGVRPIREE